MLKVLKYSWYNAEDAKQNLLMLWDWTAYRTPIYSSVFFVAGSAVSIAAVSTETNTNCKTDYEKNTYNKRDKVTFIYLPWVATQRTFSWTCGLTPTWSNWTFSGTLIEH